MDWWITFDQQAADYLPDLRIEKEEPMDRHTSFRIGGPARRMAFPERGEQLVLLLDMAARCGARPLVMGNGTNLLAPDEGLDRLKASTQIMITPLDYEFRIVHNIVTNFHQPKSTLLLLVSAFVGDGWRRIYDYALGHGFRFLSYGDSSVLLRE